MSFGNSQSSNHTAHNNLQLEFNILLPIKVASCIMLKRILKLVATAQIQSY